MYATLKKERNEQATTAAYNTYNVPIISEPSHPMAFQAMSQTHYG